VTLPHKQSGQIMPLAIGGILLAAAMMMIMASAGNKFTERSRLVNTADAAAYSGAVWTARHLNFIAYTNRAMIANHVGTGHFVAYLSWIRYIEDTTGNLALVTSFIPVVNAATETVADFATILRELAEFEAEIFVPGVDILNRLYFVAQAEAHLSLIINSVDGVMQQTADNFDADIRINDQAAIGNFDPLIGAPIRFAIGAQRLIVPLFVRPLSVVDRDNELVNLVEGTYGAQVANVRGEMSTEWLLDRGFEVDAFLIEIEKEFETEHTLGNDLSDWEAEDELVFRILPVTPFGSVTKISLGKGSASAREFDDSYRGIFAYYGQTLFEPANHTLPILALATKQQVAAGVAEGAIGLRSEGVLSGLSVAQVEFTRPRFGFGSLGGGNDEFANPYNPFWQPRLVSSGL